MSMSNITAYRPIRPKPQEDSSLSRNLHPKIPYSSLRCPIPSCPHLFPNWDILTRHLKSEHEATTEPSQLLDLPALQAPRPSGVDRDMQSHMHVLHPGASEAYASGGPDDVIDRTTLHTELISLPMPSKASSPSIHYRTGENPDIGFII
ncbi:hypothetical protein BC938DRAFT_482666 [Jimgerdemannia flammicorona]|uniref:C2H2-type domain-containing protein n=1 Tax=Jimgerdemannia flammicorona TaxID=994334 RepID=A0A433QDF0_9FUNG|nr:hypothetical protein BC938DRAFT_482666 [Jimgerdemannia flammicorona]